MKKVSIFLIIFVSLFFISDVKAYSLNYWYNSNDYIMPTRAYIYSLGSGFSTTNVTSISSGYNNSDNIYYEYYTNSSNSYSFGSNGMAVSFVANQVLTDNYMYALSFNLCSVNYLPNTSNYFVTISNDGTSFNNSSITSYAKTYKTISNLPLESTDFGYCYQYLTVFRSNSSSSFIETRLVGSGQNAFGLSFFGYNLYNLGYANNLSDSDISDVIKNSGLASADSIDDVQSSINQVQEEISGMQQEQQETNDKLDDITNMDIPDESKEDLDNSSYQDYSDAESDLMDSVGQADLSEVDIAIDSDSSNFIWDTITNIFESHPLIMSTVIAILSIGIIKLALGR